MRPSEVGCCEFEYVPDFRGGSQTGEVRRCKNAVRLPERFCHQHGGQLASSFAGKTLAKAAAAEAQRGELYPVAAEHWEGAEARYEVLEGQIAEMLRTDPNRLAKLYEASRRGDVGRY